MKLYEYYGKRIKITDVDGQTFIGLGDNYTSELDDPDGVASLTLNPDNRDNVLISFTESEIAYIEVLSVDAPIMANVV